MGYSTRAMAKPSCSDHVIENHSRNLHQDIFADDKLHMSENWQSGDKSGHLKAKYTTRKLDDNHVYSCPYFR